MPVLHEASKIFSTAVNPLKTSLCNLREKGKKDSNILHFNAIGILHCTTDECKSGWEIVVWFKKKTFIKQIEKDNRMTTEWKVFSKRCGGRIDLST